MRINDTQVFELDKISTIYPHLPKTKMDYCESLAREGYFFFTNNSHAMDTQARWNLYELIRVGRTPRRKPGVLWAVKNLPLNRCEE